MTVPVEVNTKEGVETAETGMWASLELEHTPDPLPFEEEGKLNFYSRIDLIHVTEHVDATCEASSECDLVNVVIH